ncbi:MAG: electron transport complex subunit RsxC [Thiotrichales bacterium]
MSTRNTAKRRLYHFHGGVHPETFKAESTNAPVGEIPSPRRVTLPLSQHIGAPAAPVVEPGDHVAKGQLIARPGDHVSSAIHASISGTVTAIEDRQVPHASGLPAPCIEIEADGEDRWAPDLPAPIQDLSDLDHDAMVERIAHAGIVGLGGAAFPTSIKLGTQQRIKTLIVNGVECEPYITCDDMLMREHAAEILRGIEVAQALVKPDQTLFAIEDNKPQAIAAVTAALEANPLAATEVVAIPTLYPSGGEKQLIMVLTGEEVPSGGLPLDLGIVCQNVGTLFAVGEAVYEGRPLTRRIVTVTGEAVSSPQNFWVPLGTSFHDVVQAAGGYQPDASQLIMGGPMMGLALPSDEVPVVKATNCILVQNDSALPATPTACIRCGECARVCPAQLLPQQLYWHTHARDFEKAQEYNLFDCIECGCCSYVCPSQIPLVQYYRFAKTEIRHQEAARKKSDLARERHEFHQARLEKAAREKAEKLAAKKAALAKKQANQAGKESEDPKKAAIDAALARAKAKKEQRAAESPESRVEESSS